MSKITTMFTKFLVASVLLILCMVGFSFYSLYAHYGGNMDYKTHRFKRFDSPISVSSMRLYDMHGRPVFMKDFKGKPGLVVLFASWCGYCAKEMKILHEHIEQFNDIHLIPVAEPKDTSLLVERFFERIGIEPIPHYYTPDGSMYYAVKARGVPSFYVINKHAELVGSVDPNWRSFESLKRVLKAANIEF